jgi:zinc protease
MNRDIGLALCLAFVATACGAAPPPAAVSAPATAPAVPESASAAAPASAPAAPVSAAVLTLPPGQSPAVAIRLAFRSGFADDPPDADGITALAAQLIAEGGSTQRKPHALKETLFPWAARIEVSVDADMTVFSARVHRDHAAALVPVLAEVLTQPRWSSDEFERMRRDAVDEIETRLRTADDETLGKEALAHLLFAGHPYGRYVGGSVNELKALTLERVRSHAARVFGRARLTIGVSGGWPPGLPEQLAAALASLPPGEPVSELPVEGGLRDTRVLIVDKPAPAVAFSLGARVAFDRAHPDFPALVVGLSAFGEHRQFHGRLMQRLREARGLNYGDYAYPEFFRQAGWSTFAQVNIPRRQQMFSIWLRPVQPADALFALRLALHEYDRLLRDGLTADEVTRAARFLEGYTRLFEKDADRRLGLALDDGFYGTPARLERLRAALPALTAETVNAALRRHLPAAADLKIAVVSDKAAAFRDAILADAPSPKTYASEKPADVLETDAQASKRPFGLKPEAVQIVPVGSLF